ncbi:MAG: 50S ribosomal protein L11 methyltransferase [Ruminococcaceae bacterium]|nr:50S ribosomal protein L11 methyltransferase [Oscillospiraceae bacterium]
MEWTQITINVSPKDIDLAGDIANMTVPYGIYIEDYTDLEQGVEEIAHVDLIDEELLKKDRNIAKIHIYIDPEDSPAEAVAFLKERYLSEGIEHTIEEEKCEEDDWLNNWRKYFKPTEVGEKLLICPSWHELSDTNGRVVLDIDPGLAFGTGKHETTRLCLSTLEKYVKEGVNVLDVGCGSGILGIASLLLGAGSAFGVDIDPLAVRTAKDNAKVNKVEDRFEVVCGDLTEKVQGKYDIIVANIVADAIIFLSKGVKEFMKDDTVYIMSGIIDSRLPDVNEALKDDFDIIDEIFDNGWYCLVAKAK